MVARDRVFRALRARIREWLDCYGPHVCAGQAEPTVVGVVFSITRGGGVVDARVAQITEHCWDQASRRVFEVPGDPGGPLARCLLGIVQSTRIELPASVPAPQRATFMFRPEVLECPEEEPLVPTRCP